MPLSGYLFGFGAILLVGIALYLIGVGKDKEKLSNMNDILKEIDRQKKQKVRRDEKVRNMSIDDKLDEL